mgnify:CR=1 FL=1
MLTYPDISKIDKSGPTLRRKIAVFLISCLIHSLLLYWVFSTKYTVKVFLSRQITEVIIASPEKTYMPENIEEIIKSRGPGGSPKNKEFSPGAIKFKEKTETRAPGYPEASGKEMKAQAGGLAVTPQFSSRFSLELQPGVKSNLPEGHKLDLTPPSKSRGKLYYPLESGRSTKSPNLMNYLYSSYSRVHSASGYPLRPKSGRSTQRRGISFNIEKYDLTPWAEKVVNQIQKNWTVSPGQRTNVKGEIEISVLVEKNGELSDITIVSSSNDPLLDQSALQALEASSPFPALPVDFPAKNLEIYFVFYYE